MLISSPPAIVSPAPRFTTCVNGLPESRAASAVSTVRPAWPKDVDLTHVIGVLVSVALDKTGAVTHVAVAGYRPPTDSAAVQKAFENSAIAAVKASRFQPAVENCFPVASVYVFEVSAVPGSPSGSCPDGLPPVRDAIATRVAAPRSLSGGSVTVDVRVDIDQSGNVTNATVLPGETSIPKEYAEAAIAAAKQSKFLPKIVDCKPVPSSYLFRVTM